MVQGYIKLIMGEEDRITMEIRFAHGTTIRLSRNNSAVAFKLLTGADTQLRDVLCARTRGAAQPRSALKACQWVCA